MLFNITLTYRQPPDVIKAHLETHKHWLVNTIQQGHLVFAGPLLNQAGGFILARAGSLEEIQRLLADDPFVIHALVDLTIQICEPAICAAYFATRWAPTAIAVPVFTE